MMDNPGRHFRQRLEFNDEEGQQWLEFSGELALTE